ncbi:MAG: phosphonate C-P lyase system protein PhnH [Pseudomonadota bacterium]
MSVDAVTVASPTLAPGFEAPSTHAAEAFRAAMDALARPGLLRAMPSLTAPDGLSHAAAALLLTLADPDTPVWLDDRAAGAAGWLVFHTGAAIAEDKASAALAVGPWAALMPISAWPAGVPDYPDRSTTLIIEVAALTGGPRLSLQGPGIAGRREVDPMLPDEVPRVLSENRARFPLGVDLFLAAGDSVMGLPRTTCVTAAEAG